MRQFKRINGRQNISELSEALNHGGVKHLTSTAPIPEVK